MKKKYKFTIATNKLGSEQSEVLEFEFDDDTSEQDIDDKVTELYSDWVNQKNYGGYIEIK